MKYLVTYPLAGDGADPRLADGEAVARFARTAEAAGFDGIGFTEHPAPTERWRRAGGHDAFDPFAALAYVAAVTERLALVPNICVLPYRNPFLVAKTAATLSRLSGGRFVLAAGTGYLRGEFRALGVDPDERNALFDEALVVLRGIWATDDLVHRGRHFEAVGQTADPKPVAAVPIWIGGNSERSRQRVADDGDGWHPFPAPAVLARTARTPALATPADLAVALDDLWRRVDAAGRDRSGIDVTFATATGGSPGDDGFDAGTHRAALADLADLGVTWISVTVPSDSVAHALEALARYGDQVIAPDRT